MHVPKQVLVALLLVSSCTCERGERPTQIGAPDTTAPRGSETEGRSEGVGPSPTEAPSKSLPRGEPVRLATRQDCGIWADNSVWCWSRRCAPDEMCTPVQLDFPAPPPGVQVRDVIRSGLHDCVLLDDGEVRFPERNHGQATLCRPDVLGQYRIADFVYSPSETCVLTREGEVSCWSLPALRTWEQNPDVVLSIEPRRVIDEVTRIDGLGTFCVVRRDRSVWCWGHNGYGQLGDGTFQDRHFPRKVEKLPPAANVAIGSAHVCAVTTDGAVYCWGNNTSGQLGIGRAPSAGHYPHEENVNPHDRPRPVRVQDLPGVSQLIVTGYYSCALGEDRSIYCWGGGPEHATPERLGGPPAAQLVRSSSAACLLTSDGQTYCWGGAGSGLRAASEVPKRVHWAGMPPSR